MMDELKQLCEQYNIKCILTRAEDNWYNTAIICTDGIMFVDETLSNDFLTYILPYTTNALKDNLEGGFVQFTEAGPPESFKIQDHKSNIVYLL